MAGGVAPQGNTSYSSDGKNYSGALTIVTALFFMWGFITCLNDILIPKFKDHFELGATKAMFVQSAFFSAYFLISLTYFIISSKGIDPIAKYGYKKAIIAGLSVCGLGCLIFYPAASLESYGLFLTALFILASGVTILQMGANPYVALLGAPSGASSRLNMTQAFNSLGTTVAPIIGGAFILVIGGGLETVQGPYITLAVILFLLAIIIFFVPLPKVTDSDDENDASVKKIKKGALKYSHLVLGVVCIFFYVGGEVSIGSAIINFLELDNITGLPAHKADIFLAFYWGGAMIGRFFAAILLDENTRMTTKTIILIFLILILADLLGIFLVNKDIILNGDISEWDLITPEIFEAITVVNLLAFFIGKKKPSTTLGIFALIVVGLLGITMFGHGSVAMWAVLSIGLFNSIMFPTIFTLAIKGLGLDTSQGSSLLVMAIVGGAIIPPLQGMVGDLIGLQFSFIIPLICYAYIAFYGFIGSKPSNLETSK